MALIFLLSVVAAKNVLGPGTQNGHAPWVPTSVKSSMPAENLPQAPTEKEELLQTTPYYIGEAFGRNSVRARDWVSSSPVEVTGQVDYVSNNMFGGDRTAVVFDCNPGVFMSSKVTFWFPSDFRESVAALQQGQTVTVRGSFEKEGYDDFIFAGNYLGPTGG